MFSSGLDPFNEKKILQWMEPPFDAATRKEILRMIDEDPEELKNGFHGSLSFGTGGLRGLMGVGTNRINLYTVSFLTEAIARYLKKSGNNKNRRIFIGYDCRLSSKEFAESATSIFAGHGFDVFLSSGIVSTPFTSFACRELKCDLAIMITASHNPKEYNGYKVYWSNGVQILPPHDQNILQEMLLIESMSQVTTAPLSSPNIKTIGGDLKKRYLNALESCLIFKKEGERKGDLKIIYTNLHGAGIVYLPELMKEWGYVNFLPVREQEIPDGTFPTVSAPNPEDPTSLNYAIDYLLKTGGDILIATDPDGDRMRVGARIDQTVYLFDGNQIASLLLYQVLKNLQTKNQIPKNGATVKTNVTTELFREISRGFGVACFDVPTGFKYIGNLIEKWEEGPYSFIFGAEESYGTLTGKVSRDKDGILASLIIAEAAFEALIEGKTLVDRLHEIYRLFGLFGNKVAYLKFPDTKEGRFKIEKTIHHLKENPPASIGNLVVKSFKSYFPTPQGGKKDLCLAEEIISFNLEDDSKVSVRRSGTEPKIKIYVEVKRVAQGDLQKELKKAEDHCEFILDAFKNLLMNTKDEIS